MADIPGPHKQPILHSPWDEPTSHYSCKESDKQIKRMYQQLKRRIDQTKWDALFSLKSSPFPAPETHKIAVRFITNTGVEMSTVKTVNF